MAATKAEDQARTGRHRDMGETDGTARRPTEQLHCSARATRVAMEKRFQYGQPENQAWLTSAGLIITLRALILGRPELAMQDLKVRIRVLFCACVILPALGMLAESRTRPQTSGNLKKSYRASGKNQRRDQQHRENRAPHHSASISTSTSTSN